MALVCHPWLREAAGPHPDEAPAASPSPPIVSARLPGAATVETTKRPTMTAWFKISASEVRKSLPNDDDRPTAPSARPPAALPFPYSFTIANVLVIAPTDNWRQLFRSLYDRLQP